MDKHMTKTETKWQPKWRHLAWHLALALVGLVLSGGKTVFGNAPFGVATVAAASGAGTALAVTVGACIGSFHHGGILPILTIGVFVLRAILTLWLTEEQWRGAASGDGKLRHSRSRGWIWRKTTDPHRSRSDTARTLPQSDPHIQRVPNPGNKDPVGGTSHSNAKTIVFGGDLSSLLHLANTWLANDKLFHEQILLRMAISALAAFLAGAWGLVAGSFQPIDLWGMLFSTLLSPLCTYLLYAAHDRRMRTSSLRETGILAALALFCRSLSGITLPLVGFDLGEGAALAAAVLVGSSFGVSRGALVGLAGGLFLTPDRLPAYLIAGAVTGALSGSWNVVLGRGYCRALGLLAGSVAAVAWCLYSGGLGTLAGLAPEILMVSAVLLPFFAYDGCRLPDHLCGVLPDTRRSEQTALAEAALRGREKKLSDLGTGLRSLGEMLTGVSEKLVMPGKREMQALAEGCFAVYCDRCPQYHRCREEEYPQWQEMLTRFAQALTEDGGVCGRDVPATYASRCGVMGRVLDEINATVARRMSERRSGERLRVSAENYLHMGQLLHESAKLEEETSQVDKALTAQLTKMLSCNDFAASSVTAYGTRYKRIFVHDIDLSGTRMGGEEIMALFGKVVGMPLSPPTFSLDGELLSMELHTRHCAHCTCGRCSLSAEELRQVDKSRDRGEGDAIDIDAIDIRSGDTIRAFVGDGRQYMLLSDGMGTGRMAALTSGMAAAFLTQMLTAGATLETTLKMLNSVLRASCDEYAATMDLCEIDLVTMEVCFVKSGAAPSFVLRDGSLFRLQSKTVPIGILRALDAERIRFTVQPGDVIVMLSDGIAHSFEECPWLLDLLTTNEDLRCGNVQSAAETIVREAARHGAIDDITAGVMLVESEGEVRS